MCEIDLGDVCEVWIPTERVAKKAHTCAACARVIPPGERYHHTFAVFEGEPSMTKHCRDCDRDIRAFAKAHDDQSPHPTALSDVLQECIDEGLPGEERRWKAMLTRLRSRTLAMTPPPTGAGRGR